MSWQCITSKPDLKQNICLICFPAWSLAFEPEEVAVDEAVSMDASDVGWGETPAATTDTGWATFDSFTDIRMAPSRFVHCLSNWHVISTLDYLGLEQAVVILHVAFKKSVLKIIFYPLTELCSSRSVEYLPIILCASIINSSNTVLLTVLGGHNFSILLLHTYQKTSIFPCSQLDCADLCYHQSTIRGRRGSSSCHGNRAITSCFTSWSSIQ